MSITEEQDKKAELIAQLLAKAESTTPEEAEALTEAAEKLMIKYAIDQAVIEERRFRKGIVSEEIVTKIMQFNGAYRLDTLSLGVSVINGLGSLRALQSTSLNKKAWLHIVGFESDVDQAIVLINSLSLQSMVAMRAWWKDNKEDYQHLTPYDQEAARRSFVRGFGAGAGKRIKENRNQAVEEAGTATDLVLVSRAARVDTFYDDLSKTPNRARGGKGSAEALVDGHHAGQQANTGEKAVTHHRAITA